jgi:hypothetical protein
MLDHFYDGSAAGRRGRLHVNIFLRHLETLRGRELLQQLQLRRNLEAFLLLLLRGHAGIDHRLLSGGIGHGCWLQWVGHVV